jgi:ribonuclease HII
MRFPTYKYETQKYLEGFKFVAGCDEVGIGPLAGPVVGATVILDSKNIIGLRSKNKWWSRIRDSKSILESERELLAQFIKDNCLDFGVGTVSQETIDEINILQASLLAMEKSVNGLKLVPDFIFLDGVHKLTKLPIAQQAVVDGDAKILSISAASIIAKVARDRTLNELNEIYPEYGFDKHKGYDTKLHREAILKFGITPMHRKTFGFVQQYLENPAFTGMGNNL